MLKLDNQYLEFFNILHNDLRQGLDNLRQDISSTDNTPSRLRRKKLRMKRKKRNRTNKY